MSELFLDEIKKTRMDKLLRRNSYNMLC